MSVRFCGKCGAGWGADFNFCAKDGTPLNVQQVAQLGAATEAVSHHDEPQVSKPPSRKLARKPVVREPAPSQPPTQIEAPRVEAESSRSPWSKASRAPAEVPPAAHYDMPDFDFGQAHVHAEPAPRIEGPATRGRRRPAKEAALKEVAAAPAIAKAIKDIAAEPVEAQQAEAMRGEANVESIFIAKKRRDSAAFSETAWFRRPLETAQIDPVSGRVAHTESTYRPDPKVTPTQRRKFSLRKTSEAV